MQEPGREKAWVLAEAMAAIKVVHSEQEDIVSVPNAVQRYPINRE